MKKTIYSPVYRMLIQRLRLAREAKGLKQEQVARKLGVSRQWLGSVERCQLRLDVVQLVRLCRVCGVSAIELVQSVEEKP